MHGSGYVPINFYPCTIADKISTMRGATVGNPSPELPPGNVTTTEAPDQVGGDVVVSDGLWSDVRGCYATNGTANGKTQYLRETDFGCIYYIFWSPETTGWQLWSQCGNTEAALIANNPTDVGDHVPLIGWQFGYVFENGSCD